MMRARDAHHNLLYNLLDNPSNQNLLVSIAEYLNNRDQITVPGIAGQLL